jgi:phosphomevalonate kinase
MTMTRRIEADAPGKLMLLGEYAVLRGAPALVCAVDRRARVTVELAAGPPEPDPAAPTPPEPDPAAPTPPEPDPVAPTPPEPGPPDPPTTALWHRLTSPLLDLADFPFRLAGGRFVPGARLPAAVRPQLGLVERVLEVTSQATGGPGMDVGLDPPPSADPGSEPPPSAPGDWPPLHLHLDTRDLRDARRKRGGKLGLGSSAALTVALVGALRRLTPDGAVAAPVSRSALFPVAWRAHRAAQGERGSGFDLAAALYGGVLRYRAPAPGKLEPDEATALRWPAGLGLAVVWTGQSADTVSLTARVAAARHRRPDAFAAVDAELAALARQGADNFAAGQLTAFLQTVRGFAAALQGLGRQAGVDILSAAHQQLSRRAEAHGLAYKPAGAGGGDIGVAFGEPEALARFVREGLPRGASPLSLTPGAPGLAVRITPPPGP